MQNLFNRTYNKKIRLLTYLMVAICTIFLSVMHPEPVSAASPSLNRTKITIVKGTKTKLVLRNAGKNISWKSSKSKVASVDKNGLVTANSIGTVKISAVYKKKTYKCTVCVIPATQKITLNKTTYSMKGKGKQFTLKASIKPKNAQKTLSWSSSNKSVVTVSSKGVVTSVGNGTAYITATATDGTKKTARCRISVSGISSPKPVSKVITNIQLGCPVLSVYAGDTISLKVSVIPSSSKDLIKWTSSDTGIATVSNGKIHFLRSLKPGEKGVTIKCASLNSKAYASFTFYPQAITVSDIKATLPKNKIKKGEKLTIPTSVIPTDAENRGYKWTSLNPDIASVTASGIVTGISDGTAVLSCKSDDGFCTILRTIIVDSSIPATDIQICGFDINKAVTGETLHLSARILPKDATDKRVIWKTSNSRIATITKDGVVTFHSPEIVTITCQTYSGLTKGLTFPVSEAPSSPGTTYPPVPVSSIDFSDIDLLHYIGDTFDITATVSPSTATNKSVIWTSSDTNIATVSSSGRVICKSAGSVKITCSSADGNAYKCIIFTVSKIPDILVKDINISWFETIACKKGTIVHLKAEIIPANATNKNYTWSTSDPSVATITADGVLTVLKDNVGFSIRCTSADDSHTFEQITISPQFY